MEGEKENCVTVILVMKNVGIVFNQEWMREICRVDKSSRLE